MIKLDELPNEILDLITSYLWQIYGNNTVTLISKNFYNLKLYKTKLGKVGLNLCSFQHNIERQNVWNTFTKSIGIDKDLSVYSSVELCDKLYNSKLQDNLKEANNTDNTYSNINDFMINDDSDANDKYNINYDEDTNTCNTNTCNTNNTNTCNTNTHNINTNNVQYINYPNISILQNPTLYNLLYSCQKLTVPVQIMEQVLHNIKYTNISKLHFYSCESHEDEEREQEPTISNIPNNITELYISDIGCKRMLFAPNSAIKTIKFQEVYVEKSISLPHSIENIELSSSFVHFVDYKYDNLKSIKFNCDTTFDDRCPWLPDAILMASDVVYTPIYFKYNRICVSRAKRVKTICKNVSKIHKDVEVLELFVNEIYVNTSNNNNMLIDEINKFTKLRDLTILYSVILGDKFRHLESLKIKCISRGLNRQKLDIRCKNLIRVDLHKCELLNVNKDNNIKHLKTVDCELHTIKFSNLKSLSLDNTIVTQNEKSIYMDNLHSISINKITCNNDICVYIKNVQKIVMMSREKFKMHFIIDECCKDVLGDNKQGDNKQDHKPTYPIKLKNTHNKQDTYNDISHSNNKQPINHTHNKNIVSQNSNTRDNNYNDMLILKLNNTKQLREYFNIDYSKYKRLIINFININMKELLTFKNLTHLNISYTYNHGFIGEYLHRFEHLKHLVIDYMSRAFPLSDIIKKFERLETLVIKCFYETKMTMHDDCVKCEDRKGRYKIDTPKSLKYCMIRAK